MRRAGGRFDIVAEGEIVRDARTALGGKSNIALIAPHQINWEVFIDAPQLRPKGRQKSSCLPLRSFMNNWGFEKFCDLTQKDPYFLDLTLPNLQDRPAELLKLSSVQKISFSIAMKFGEPEIKP